MAQKGSYLGAQTTGSGQPIPVNPSTGQLDINALVGQIVDRRKYYFYDTLKLAPGATVSTTPYMLFKNPVGQGDPYNGNITKTELDTNMTDCGQVQSAVRSDPEQHRVLLPDRRYAV